MSPVTGCVIRKNQSLNPGLLFFWNSMGCINWSVKGEHRWVQAIAWDQAGLLTLWISARSQMKGHAEDTPRCTMTARAGPSLEEECLQIIYRFMFSRPVLWSFSFPGQSLCMRWGVETTVLSFLLSWVFLITAIRILLRFPYPSGFCCYWMLETAES